MKLIIHTDGGARGNPGPAAIGAVIQDESGKVLHEISEYIGETTNNQAEYRALLAALKKAQELSPSSVQCKLDSLLVVKQLNREYKVKDAGLAKVFVEIWNLAQSFPEITFVHIRREFNKEADRLVNEALDRNAENE